MIHPRYTFALMIVGAIGFAQPARSGSDWERAKPEDQGYSSKGLAALSAYLGTLNTSGMIAVHDGKIIFEYGNISQPGMLTSVRKSMLGLLYGNYVVNGKINLDATLADLGIDDVGGLLPIEKRARVRDVLAARSGVFHKNTNPRGGDDLYLVPPRGTLELGAYFMYNNWDFNVAGYIFEKQTGFDIFDAFEKDIARPTGMQDFDRKLQEKAFDDRTLSNFPAYRVWLSTRDMARVGVLMLQNGKWGGKQVIPAEWIKTITSLVTPVDEMNPPAYRPYSTGMLWGYGYLWWVWDDHHTNGPFRGAYTANGNGGQFITVLPGLNLVVAHRAPTPEPGQPARSVSMLQYHAALLQLLNAQCQGPCDRQ